MGGPGGRGRSRVGVHRRKGQAKRKGEERPEHIPDTIQGRSFGTNNATIPSVTSGSCSLSHGTHPPLYSDALKKP